MAFDKYERPNWGVFINKYEDEDTFVKIYNRDPSPERAIRARSNDSKRRSRSKDIERRNFFDVKVGEDGEWQNVFECERRDVRVAEKLHELADEWEETGSPPV